MLEFFLFNYFSEQGLSSMDPPRISGRVLNFVCLFFFFNRGGHILTNPQVFKN